MIHVGDCRAVMRELEANSFDAIVTDPPYHLTNPGGGGPHGKGLETPFARARAGAAATGFMGKKWDGGKVAHDPATWAEALRVAKPGAWLAAFGGTRTYHRLACAIEDAGWELRDSMLHGHMMPALEDCEWLAGWLYGSGFPKSRNGEWGGTALKPAWEPIVLARKPLVGNHEANFAEYGTGGLRIDECRIEGAKGSGNWRGMGGTAGELYEGGFTKPEPSEQDARGRWPANLLHDGSDEVVAIFPVDAGADSPVLGTEPGRATANTYNPFQRAGGAFHGDTGSAARFFYCPKASGEDRNDGADNHHPTVKPTELMRWLCRLLTPRGGTILDPFCGSGSTGRGAILEGFGWVGIELDPEYAAIAEARTRVVPPGLALGVPA